MEDYSSIVNDIAQVNLDKYIGCGLCAVTCSNNAIIMKKFKREDIPGVKIIN
ncbi:MAG: hypothetical protein KAV01_00460 [Candidatus Lokiarchaeota archaeon]|nr:hypothetical protein [Candidatus Lokiarchaeota archaeon]MCK4478975.1 hypothetical protein [Candidatus Lokiarchaeota archaeon]